MVALHSLFIVVVGFVTYVNGENPCHVICPMYYKAMCGICDGRCTLQTFGNDCLLGKENTCNERGCEYLHDGECVDSDYCIRTCPPDAPDVCATDGVRFKLFEGACELENYNKCNEQNFSETYLQHCSCPWPCTKIYRPVCGESCDGGTHTFANLCLLESHNCCNTPKFKFKHNGTCTEEC